MSEQTTIRAVNAYVNDEGVPHVIVALMGEDGGWQTFRLSAEDAVTLADMLRLLTRTTD